MDSCGALGKNFHIENIPINNLPLQVEPIAIWMCFKVELLLHFIPISLCHLTKKFLTSKIIWIKVQNMEGCNDHGAIFSKINKDHYKI
jgi:hypothetical protein